MNGSGFGPDKRIERGPKGWSDRKWSGSKKADMKCCSSAGVQDNVAGRLLLVLSGDAR